ncbi:MAG: hypothetical protein ACTSR2_15380, partial [Candidatus Hodarchaeales archaeon]
MASKVLLIGIPILVIGLILFGLFGLIGLSFYPFTGSTGVQTLSINVNPATSRDIPVIQDVPGHPFFVSIKVQAILEASPNVDCSVSLKYESSDTVYSSPIPGTTKDYYSEQYAIINLNTVISPEFAGRGFMIYLVVDNRGSNAITVTQSRVDLQFTLFSHVVPLLLLLIGGILTIIGFVKRKKGPSVKTVKEVPAGWDPTLQWGSSSAKKAASPTAGKKP